jgi:hypothetical protein
VFEDDRSVNASIAAQRLVNQRITQTGPGRPADLVAWLGAMQAQEYPAAKWALALRMPESATDADIERALDEGRILRTHVMRPTWHFVAPSDIHWMLDLTAPRVHRALASMSRQFGLDSATCTRATKIFERSLMDGSCLTRAELGGHLARSGLVCKGVPLALLSVYAELEGVICSGPRRGKQSTYALLETRVPRAGRLSRDEALGELTERYFRSHGPATIRDFVWWSGLTTADARRGLEIKKGSQEEIDGRTYWTIGARRAGRVPRAIVHLLPIYDEYLVAYRDLHAVPRNAGSRGTLPQALVAAGQVAGTWKAVPTDDRVLVAVTPERPLTRLERRGLAETAARYGRFLGKPVKVTVA